MINRIQFPVRYAETDKMGVVHHAQYLVYFEAGRTAFLEELGYPFPKMEAEGLMAPITRSYLEYGEPLRYGQDAVVYTAITKFSPVRYQFTCKVFAAEDNPQNDTPRVAGWTENCIVDATTFKPISGKHAVPELYALYEANVEPDFALAENKHRPK